MFESFLNQSFQTSDEYGWLKPAKFDNVVIFGFRYNLVDLFNQSSNVSLNSLINHHCQQYCDPAQVAVSVTENGVDHQDNLCAPCRH